VNDDGAIGLFVNGTLMRGLALHGNLDGATFVAEARTAPSYRLCSIDDVHPAMCRADRDGAGVSVAGELYHVPLDVLRRVEEGGPPDLYRGRVELSDGREVDGILYPPDLARKRGRDISDHGGWRAYIASSDAAT
jgi:AGZA family xanthine/uracil permease-like MFS transporter